MVFPLRSRHSWTAWKISVVLLFIVYASLSRLFSFYQNGLPKTSTSNDDASEVGARGVSTSSTTMNYLPNVTKLSLGHISKLVRWWNSFSPSLVNANPKCSPVQMTHDPPEARDIRWDPNNLEKARFDHLHLTEEQLACLKDSHKKMIEVALLQALKLPYKRNTRGIVTTVTDDYVPVFLVSLRMLRLAGSKLPVEVFFTNHDEYIIHKYTCDHILPQLNALCRLFSDVILTGDETINNIGSYQYKVLAMLFSSFEDILFLNADTFPVWNPDEFLLTEPFRSAGFVTWPDFWESTASPLFYQIAALDVPPLSVRPSSESDQLLLSKRTHAAVLLLAAYYNYYGPNYFYPLLYQGAVGQGDKETYLHAAMALNRPFYDVRRPVSVLGHSTDDEHVGLAMLQGDPTQDNEYSSGRRVDEPRGFFIHNNVCKLHAEGVFAQKCLMRDGNGNWKRLWGPKEHIVEKFGFDVEERVWQQIIITKCERGESDGCNRFKSYYLDMYRT
jgi:alpha 1,2-mannosyltransferase